MEESSYPFRSLGHALSFFISHAPTRARSFNLLEPERGSRPTVDDFSGDSPLDHWVTISKVIQRTLRHQPYEARRCFQLRNHVDRTKQKHPRDIAIELGLPKRMVYKFLDEINEDLASRLAFQGLIPPRPKKEVA